MSANTEEFMAKVINECEEFLNVLAEKRRQKDEINKFKEWRQVGTKGYLAVPILHVF